MAGARTQSEPPDTRADTTAPDDGLLAVRAAEGDEDAFAVLVQRHAAALIRLATSLLGTGAEAEDAVQDAFLSAWRRLPEFQGRSSFGTWMYRIVTNRCLNVLRARKPVAPLEAAGDVPAAEHATSPARITEGRDAVRELGRPSTCSRPNNGPAGYCGNWTAGPTSSSRTRSASARRPSVPVSSAHAVVSHKHWGPGDDRPHRPVEQRVHPR